MAAIVKNLANSTVLYFSNNSKVILLSSKDAYFLSPSVKIFDSGFGDLADDLLSLLYLNDVSIFTIFISLSSGISETLLPYTLLSVNILFIIFMKTNKNRKNVLIRSSVHSPSNFDSKPST